MVKYDCVPGKSLGKKWKELLRTGRASVAIRRFVRSYTRTLVCQLGRNQLERYSWTGTSYSYETGSRPTGFPMCICICPSPGRIGSNKQCFQNHFMHTCLLRATGKWSAPKAFTAGPPPINVELITCTLIFVQPRAVCFPQSCGQESQLSLSHAVNGQAHMELDLVMLVSAAS